MKTNFNYHTNNAGKSSKGSGYYPQRLSIKEAVIWFLLTAAALFLSGTSQSQNSAAGVQPSGGKTAMNSNHRIFTIGQNAIL